MTTPAPPTLPAIHPSLNPHADISLTHLTSLRTEPFWQGSRIKLDFVRYGLTYEQLNAERVRLLSINPLLRTTQEVSFLRVLNSILNP